MPDCTGVLLCVCAVTKACEAGWEGCGGSEEKGWVSLDIELQEVKGLLLHIPIALVLEDDAGGEVAHEKSLEFHGQCGLTVCV